MARQAWTSVDSSQGMLTDEENSLQTVEPRAKCPLLVPTGIVCACGREWADIMKHAASIDSMERHRG